MGKLKQLAAKLRREAPRQEAAILDIVQEFEPTMIDMNTSQLLEGKDSQGESLRKYRNPLYARKKLQLNPRGVTDLNVTGSFYRGFVAITDKWPVIFSSTNSKTGRLVDDYGENIFGLNKQNKRILSREYLKESIQQYYRSLFQL